MLLSPLRLLPIVALAVLASGCLHREDARPGLIIDVDGSMHSTTSENVAMVHGNRFARDLAELAEDDLAGYAASIAELPVAGEDADGFSTWTYPSVTLSVVIPATSPLDEAAIRELAWEQFHDHLAGPRDTRRERLAVVIERGTVATDADEPTPAADRPQPTVPPAAPSADDGQTRRYIVQRGDTLGQISAVFYGSAQHWRVIAEANDVDPAQLVVGQELVIPALGAED